MLFPTVASRFGSLRFDARLFVVPDIRLSIFSHTSILFVVCPPSHRSQRAQCGLPPKPGVLIDTCRYVRSFLLRSVQLSHCSSKFAECCYVLSFVFSLITFTLKLNPYDILPSATFWTNRGHRFVLFPHMDCLHFIARKVQHSRFLALYSLRFSPDFAYSRSSAFRSRPTLRKEEIPTNTSMDLVRREPATLTAVGTRSIYYSIGDADFA